MNENITLERRDTKNLANLPHGDYPKVRNIIKKLSENPRPKGC